MTETPATSTVGSSELAKQLEQVSGKALTWLDDVLSQPVDPECGSLLRAQASAAQTALNAQLRADAQRMRAERQDRALERLIEAIRSQEGLVPKTEGRSLSTGSLGHAL